MKIGYTLHMPFWERVKLLFGWGLRVEADTSPDGAYISVFVEGAEEHLKPIITYNEHD
jgi:hypothetical protein